jgi:hypothetical protein
MSSMPISYNPGQIFKQKRAHRERLNDLTQPDQEKKKEGPLYDALAYLNKLADSVQQIDDMFNEMKDLVKALDSTPDSRVLNKQFEAKKSQIEQIALSPWKDGDTPLSGKYASEPKIIPLEEGMPRVELKIEGFTMKGLAINDIRIDALSYAKKASSEIARVKDIAASQQRIIGGKIETVRGRIASVEISQTVSPSVFRNYASEELKELQERTARAEGRTSALLINIKA